MTDAQTNEDVAKPYVNCPFCGEHDFDLYGLKMHLLRWCEDFDNCKEPKLTEQNDERAREGRGASPVSIADSPAALTALEVTK